MKSLDKVLKILDYLQLNYKLSLKELSEKLEINKSTIYRLLAYLAKHNYIEKEPDTKKYKLGLKFVEIANHIIQNLEIKNIASKNINELNEITKETVHLAQLIGDKIVYIDKRESLSPIRLYSQIGKITPWHCTGVGKVILAFQDKEFQERIINSIQLTKYTENTITGKSKLQVELDKIKEQGFALDREEHQKNVGCIAAPIKDYTRKVIASISVTFIFDIENLDKHLTKYKDLILDSSYQISKKLGYNP